MATETKLEILCRDGVEHLVAIVKNLLANKQDVGTGIFVDRTTGKKYTIYVDNGKLLMEDADS